MIGAAVAIGARLVAGSVGRAAAGKAVQMGASEALGARAGAMASKATIAGGDYAAQRMAQRQAEHRGNH